LLGVSRSSHYRWRQRATRAPTPTQQHRAQVAAAITMLFLAHRQRPGRRPMQHLLAAAGYPASLGRIDRLMRTLGLQARRGRTRRLRPRIPGPSPALTATITNHCLDAAGHRDFTSAQPGTKTVGDITKLPTSNGPLFLATVLDLATRRVLGWATSAVPDTALVLQALTSAQPLLAPGAVFHSDRGSPYTSHLFQHHCTASAVTQSLGTTGTCYDNAVAEAFFATLKGDARTELGPSVTTAEALAWLGTWIEEWYNPYRPHSANGGLPPLAAWNAWCPKIIPVSDA
jgi:transposase InsO family protein